MSLQASTWNCYYFWMNGHVLVLYEAFFQWGLSYYYSMQKSPPTLLLWNVNFSENRSQGLIKKVFTCSGVYLTEYIMTLVDLNCKCLYKFRCESRDKVCLRALSGQPPLGTGRLMGNLMIIYGLLILPSWSFLHYVILL